ncbi:MAG: permease-like cell division protein FtsX [Halioglobus sp.]|nr:permease-like cell division protein FtsX [Halioglobus sp.]
MVAPDGRPRRGGGASLSRTGLRDVSRGWLQHHRLSAAQSLQKVLVDPLASLMTWLVIGIALALPAGLNMLLDNAERLSAGWNSPAQVSLFLDAALQGDDVDPLLQQVDAIDGVTRTTFVSREQALEEFRALSGFADVVESLRENPLPDAILVALDSGLDGAAVAAVREQMRALPGVEEVVLDLAWLQRLQQLMELGRRFILALGLVLALGVALILGNTIRLAIESRRDEIEVTKLVGGSNSFVRRPFLYTGLWYGVGGGLVAGLLVAAATWFLRAPVAALGRLYESSFTLHGLGVMGVLDLVLLGGVLGLLGAWLAVARHLANIEPR